MSRTPVLLQGPPKGPSRTPVVIRAGKPPRAKGTLVDTLTGVIGGLLLLLAVALYGILPEGEPPARVFNVTYTDSVVEVPLLLNFDFTEEQTHRFPIQIDSASVYTIQFTAEWTDNFASTLPDTFEFQIIDPNGEPVGAELRSSNDPGTSDDNPVLPQFSAVTKTQIISAEVAPPPSDGPQNPSSDSEDFANAQARIADETNTRPVGEWMLEVRLVDAGDCPEPADDPPHAAACELETNQAGDPGNSLQVVNLKFTSYDALVVA